MTRQTHMFIATKSHVPVVSYLVSGTTTGAGAARMAQEQIQQVDPHIYLGFSLSEVALLMGIVGTVVTMTFQYLNYRNNKKAKAQQNNK